MTRSKRKKEEPELVCTPSMFIFDLRISKLYRVFFCSQKFKKISCCITIHKKRIHYIGAIGLKILFLLPGFSLKKGSTLNINDFFLLIDNSCSLYHPPAPTPPEQQLPTPEQQQVPTPLCTPMTANPSTATTTYSNSTTTYSENITAGFRAVTDQKNYAL